MIVLGRAKVKAGTGHFDGAVRRGAGKRGESGGESGGESDRRGGADSGSVPKRLHRRATVAEERVERRSTARAGLAARI
jgi:hypothetical protein